MTSEVIMRHIQVRDFKAGLAGYLRLVEKGEVIAITRHRRPVAVLSSPPEKLPPGGRLPEEQWFQAAIRDDIVLPGGRPASFQRGDPALQGIARRAVRQLIRDRRR